MKSPTSAPPASLPPSLERRFRSWFKCLAASAVASFLTSALPASAQIAAWDFTGETSVSTSNAEVYDVLLDSSFTLTRGATVNPSAGGNSFRTTGFKNEGIATTNTDYFQATLSATAGYTLSLSTIDAKFAGTASFTVSPGVSSQFAYSLDGTNFTLIGSPILTIGTPATLPQIDVSGVTALQNIPAATTVIIRYYASGQSDSGGWGFNSATAGAYGLAFGGSVDVSGVVDTTPPALVSVSPADGSASALPTTGLSITYDESVIAGSGAVVIKKSSDDSTVEAVTVPSAQVTFSGATVTIDPVITLDDATAYYVEVPAGTFQDAATNLAPAIPVVPGIQDWTFTTRAAPSVVISQYYEGVSNNKYIELRNLTGSPIDLSGYRLTAWSAPDNQTWKTGSGSTANVSVLDGETIPANGYFLIGDSSAAGPGYAFSNTDLWQSFPSGVSFSGSGSVVLYSSATNDLESVVDAISITATEGLDTSFYRLTNGTGFDFSSGSSILDYSGVWGSKTVAQVDAALVADDWYLQASQPPVALTLSIVAATISEGAGVGAATATVTRDGPTDDELYVSISVSDFSEVYAEYFVNIPIGSSEATFPIDAVDDPYLDGDQQVTVTVSSTGFSPASEVITVTDELTDAVFPVVINEVDSSQDGTDAGEFIELYNNSGNEVSLDGVVLVFYNGGDNESNFTIDLTGQVIAANGFFVLGNPAVTNVNITFPNGDLQDGPEALALYLGSASDYPTGTPVATTAGTLMDALVYGTNDADNTVLLAALTSEAPQANEGSASAVENVSLSRLPNGGAAFDTTLYVTQTPTPGVTNILPSNTLATWISGYDVGAETGVNGDFDNDGLDNAIENILGGDPSLSSKGMTSVSSTANSVTFQHTLSATPASDLSAAYEWSTDMATWYPDGGSDGGTTVSFSAPSVIIAGSPDLIEVTATADGPVGKLFARLKVTNP